jgi:hypothetical protein
MIKKIKFLPVIILATMYLVGFVFAFSGDLIQQIQTVRQHKQVNKKNNIETISLSLSQWSNLSDKHEIKIDKVYYDVVSHSIVGSNIILKVVKDHFESEIRVFFAQVFHKNKLPNSEKKKVNFLTSQIAVDSQSIYNAKKGFEEILVKNFKSNFDLKTNSFIFLIQKPPCV